MSEGGAFIAGSIIGKLILDKMGWNSAVADVDKDKQKLGSVAGEISGRFSSMGKTMTVAGGAIVGSLVAMAKQTADTAGSFLVMENQTGVSVEKLSALSYAAKVADSSIEDISMGMKKMTMNMSEMTAGTGPSGAAIKTLGIDVHDANGKIKPMDDLLLDVADRFSKMPDGATKGGLAIDLFGKSGQNLIPFLNKGREGISELTAEAEKFGLVMTKDAAESADEFGDQLTALKEGTKGIGIQIGQAMVPTLTELVLKLKDVVSGVTSWMKEHPELTRVLTTTALAAGSIMAVLGPFLIILPKIVAGVATLKAGLGGLSVASVATKAAIGILIAEVATYISILKEKKAAEEYEKEAGARLVEQQERLAEKLREAGTAAGWQSGAMDGLIAKYDGNVAALAMAIKKGKEGVDIQTALTGVGQIHAAALEEERKKQEASTLALQNKQKAQEEAKKAQEEYTSYLNSLGIFTDEQSAEALKKVFAAEGDVKKAFEDGKITGSQYASAIQTLTDEAGKHGESISTKLVPAARDLGDLWKQAPSEMEPVYSGFTTLDGALDDTAFKMGLARSEVWNYLEQLRSLSVFVTTGVFIPPLQFPDDQKTEVQKDVGDIKGFWDGLFTDVSKKFGDTIGDFVSGTTSFKDTWKNIWGGVWDTFKTYIGKMASEWIVNGMSKIISGSKDAASQSSGALSGIGTTVQTTASTVGSAIGGIVSTIMSAISLIARTVIDIVAYGITTLATAIATAITSLAAAAPALLELGLVAAAIYTAFKAGEAIVGAIGSIIGGGGGDVEQTVGYWGNAINQTIAAYGIANGQHIIQIKDQRFGEVKDKIDNLAACFVTQDNLLKKKFDEWGGKVVDKIGGVISAINGVPGASSGAVSTKTQLMRVHGSSADPEYIVRHSNIGRFTRALSDSTDSPSSRYEARVNPIEIGSILIDKGDKWMIKFFQNAIDHRVLRFQ